jgi:hypothetical protein
MPVLKYIFNLSVSQQHLLMQWKRSEIMYVYKQGEQVSLTIPFLNNFSKVFEFLMHDHLSYYLKCKLNPRQHNFLNPN